MRAAPLFLAVLTLIASTGCNRLKDVNPKNIKNTSKTLDIYSALKDPLSGDVRLFVEYYLYHPNQLTEKEKEGPFPAFVDLFKGCVFSNFRNFSNSISVTANDVHQMAPLGNGWVDCNMKEQYRFVRLQLHSGHVHHQSLQIEEIPTERAGAVAACVGPLFSHRPDIHNWMFHMMQLGVHRFHMYLPTIHAHEKDAFEAVHEMWMTVKDFNFRHGETHTDPFHPFEHPLASWHHYSPSNRENYFGQVIMYNDCLMRTRYEYDYAVLFDVDEFIYINRTTLGKKGLLQLADYFEHAFPKMTASLEFASWHYPANCPATTVGTFFQKHKLRDQVHITGKNGKIVVRPKYAVEAFVHFVIGTTEGWAEKKLVPTESAFLKHIVWMNPAHVHCNNYVHEDSGLHPGDEGYQAIVAQL